MVYLRERRETAVGKPSGMNGGRSRNENGHLRQVRSDKLLSTIRNQYGPDVA